MTVAPDLGEWLEVLPELTFYELLRVDPQAGFDDIHRAFLAFAADFHPDTHGARSPEDRAAIERIFRRANEAFRILSSVPLRARYDELLAQGLRPSNAPASGPVGANRPSAYPSSPPSPHSSMPPEVDESAAARAPRSQRVEDRTRVSAARPFVLRAAELMRNNDPKQARIQLVMALHMDANNPALEAFMLEIEAKIAAIRR